jgi:hypothetical protein
VKKNQVENAGGDVETIGDTEEYDEEEFMGCPEGIHSVGCRPANTAIQCKTLKYCHPNLFVRLTLL